MNKLNIKDFSIRKEASFWIILYKGRSLSIPFNTEDMAKSTVMQLMRLGINLHDKQKLLDLWTKITGAQRPTICSTCGMFFDNAYTGCCSQ